MLVIFVLEPQALRLIPELCATSCLEESVEFVEANQVLLHESRVGESVPVLFELYALFRPRAETGYLEDAAFARALRPDYDVDALEVHDNVRYWPYVVDSQFLHWLKCRLMRMLTPVCKGSHKSCYGKILARKTAAISD